jgi:hypothetical protein
VSRSTTCSAHNTKVRVSGKLSYGSVFQSESVTREEGKEVRRGLGFYDTIETDDVRPSGKLWQVWNRDSIGGPLRSGNGEVETGTVELVNEDGSWVGTMRGYTTMGPRTHHYHIELTGTGAHEGFSALLYAKGLQGGPWEVEGFVFPGVLPEYPEPVEVPSD